MTRKTLSSFALLGVVTIGIYKLQENSGPSAEIMASAPMAVSVHQCVDQELQHCAEADAECAWRKFEIRPGSDHRFNWFELGMKIGEATETFIARYGLNEIDATVYEKFFRNAFVGIARAEQGGFEL
jgi:hypothetical protein